MSASNPRGGAHRVHHRVRADAPHRVRLPGTEPRRVGGVFVVGVGSLLLGAVLMVVWSSFGEAKPFFRGESLNRGTEVLVPDDELAIPRSIDGGV